MDEKMKQILRDAYWKAGGILWGNPHSEWTVSLYAAGEAVLAEQRRRDEQQLASTVTLDAVEKAAIAEAIENMKFGQNVAEIFADKLCVRLQQQEPTVQERVTVQKHLQSPDRWMVLLDGANPSSYFASEKDAERYAAGLKAELAALKEGK